MNERMLLDEWKYYQRKGECNWLLKRTLMNDNTRTAEEKKQFYMENRRIENHIYFSEEFKDAAARVEKYIDDLDGCFDNEIEKEYYLEHKYLNFDSPLMDFGHSQKAFNRFRRINELNKHVNDKVNAHLSFNPIKGAKFREYEFIRINKSDIKFIREARKHVALTVPQIEVLFGIIFFCRMNDSEKANLNSKFKMKQFIGCFDVSTMEDFEYVVSNVPRLEKTEDGDVIYYGFDDWYKEDKYGDWIDTDGWRAIYVTRYNNKLNLTKMAHKYVTDISNKRYCEMCLKPFKPTNNRQKVCPECKPIVDRINAKIRKRKQRYIQQYGKDACCGTCTDCIQTNCDNWWDYWLDEVLYRREDLEGEPGEVLEKLKYDIKNVYTEEEKAEILHWEIRSNFKKYR
jgi:hypothetical protein